MFNCIADMSVINYRLPRMYSRYRFEEVILDGSSSGNRYNIRFIYRWPALYMYIYTHLLMVRLSRLSIRTSLKKKKEGV